MITPDLNLNEIPESIVSLLWTVDHEQVSAMPVAAVVMERGNRDESRWLLRQVGLEGLRTVLPLVARRLSSRSLALWACILDIPQPTVPRIPWVAA
jgi:hypothetical protein